MSDNNAVAAGDGSRFEVEADMMGGPLDRNAFTRDMPADGSSGLQMTRILSAIRRYTWLVAGLTAVGLLAGIVMQRFSDPVYHAEATLWIQGSSEGSRGEPALGPIRPRNLLEATGWIDLLRSYTVLDSVVIEERLYVSASVKDRRTLAGLTLDERFAPGQFVLTTDKSAGKFELKSDAGVVLQSGTVGDSIGKELGFLWAPTKLPADAEIPFAIRNPREAARELNERLVTSITREENFVRLQLQGADRTRVARVVNAVADRFVKVSAELKRAQLTELVGILETQRQYAENNLRQAEIALERFRIETITLPSDEGSPVAGGLEATRDPVLGNYFEMKIQREQLRRDAQAVQQALNAGDDKVAAALASTPSVGQSPELAAAISELTTKRAELRAVRQQYTEEHPLAQRAAQSVAVLERQTIPQLGATLLSQMATRADVIDGWINSASSDLQSIPPRMIEEARLRRQVQIAERLHTDLRERFEEARLATATTIPDVRVLDHASVPDSAASNIVLRMLIFGLFGGFGVGIGLAILLDRFDGRVRYPDQVTRQLGLPILGALPHVADRNGKHANTATQALEALREIRLNLVHSVGNQHPLTLAITSPGSGDGKTFISCNLAIACASAGKRTLIIDGDTRRGHLHRMLNATRSPGLTDYLLGQVRLEECIQKTEHDGLDFIGSGARRETSPNLLGNHAMEQLLRTAYRNYDVVLIDCPPLAAGVDPYLIGTLVRNVMLVLRTGRTDRALAEAKLQILDRLPVQLIGAVLNGVEATGVYRYYSYLPGYEAPPDEVDADRLQRV